MSIVERMQPDVTQLPRCHYVAPTRSVPTLLEDVIKGFFSEPKTLPPKYFYDDYGSALFDQICNEPEYYPTRTEDALLAVCAKDIIASVRPRRILELGSGMSRKTRHLFDACDSQSHHPVYAPFDVCDDVLIKSGMNLIEQYRWLEVQPLIGDYTAGLGNLPLGMQRNLILFLGGTIGNFNDREAFDFLREIHAAMSGDDRLLLGVDRVKAPEILHAAYNDRAGITARFNLNLLDVLNRELDADFDINRFEHYAYYNPQASRIEMHLVAMSDHEVDFARLDRTLTFQEGDPIRTEISRKYTRDDIEHLLFRAGFEIETHYESDGMLFSLVLARLS